MYEIIIGGAIIAGVAALATSSNEAITTTDLPPSTSASLPGDEPLETNLEVMKGGVADPNDGPLQGGNFKITDRYTYGPGQVVIRRGRCLGGPKNGRAFAVRFYPDNGVSSRYHTIGGFGRSVDEVARKQCR